MPGFVEIVNEHFNEMVGTPMTNHEKWVSLKQNKFIHGEIDAFILFLIERVEKAELLEKAHNEEMELADRVMRERSDRRDVLLRELAVSNDGLLFAQKELAEFRRLLWLRHGCIALYGDDGEMQCGACMIDFKRMSAQEIKDAWEAEARRELEGK